MTVLFITADTVGSPTGGGLVCYQESEALRSLGLDLVTLSGKDLALERYQLPSSPFLYDYLALDAVSRNFADRSSKPDLVHFYSGVFTATVRCLKMLGVPVSYTNPAHSRKETIQEFEMLCGGYPFPHVKEPHIWALYSEGYRRADLVIAPSQASAIELKAEGCKHVEVVPHGTDIPDQVPPLPDTFCAGYLGQYGPDKGLAYLFRAWGSLGYEDATLILAGDGTDELPPVISANAGSGRFEVMGRVPQPEDLYRRISVYVQPSVTEGFGIPILEAMAHGRPVIASEGAGGAEVLTHGEDGFVVPRRDPDAIAKHLRWFKENPEKIAQMGFNARETAKKYTWEAVRSRYVELWQGYIR
ncbi:MAG TPA: glycosyltransferase family 4 protein [Polyangiaceae bacterium]